MTTNGNGKGPTWKIVATAATVALMAVFGWFANHTYSQLEKKVDKEIYQTLCDDVQEIRKSQKIFRHDQIKMMLKLGVTPTLENEDGK